MFNGEVFLDSRSDHTDDFDTDSGDLGLGSGLRPGGVCAPQTLPLYHLPLNKPVAARENLSQTPQRNSACSEGNQKRGKLTRLFSRSSSRKSSEGQESFDSEQSVTPDREFPSYADIPFGTSIRQQKLLFEQDLGHIYQKKSPPDLADPDLINGLDQREITPLKSDEIQKKLAQANQEVEELQLELENCQRRLDAKYRAINILKQQAQEAEDRTTELDKKSTDYSQRLEKANFSGDGVYYLLNGGGGNHGYQILSSNQMEDDLDLCRVCQENSALMATVKTRSEELRKLTAKNMALLREREELLALLDVQERIQYEKSRTSVSDDDRYNHFTSAQLAVLGACMCRGRKPEPCGCAVAAAHTRKEIIKLREELEMLEHRRDEAYTTVEAYRVAFEEQILRNKELGIKLAEISTQPHSKGSKTKTVLKWIIRNLNDENEWHAPASGNNLAVKSDDLDVSQFTDRELLIMILNLLNEKSELQTHQKMAAKILAKKTQELESKLEIANGETSSN